MEPFKSVEYIKIPLERVAVIIGKNGEVKKTIEERTQTQLTIDSVEGSIKIETNPNMEDPLAFFRAKAICEAIGRGFSPERAYRLFNNEEFLKLIDLKEILGKSKQTLKRIRGRVIGEKGKARAMIEEFTGSRISIYGNTVAIIGSLNQLRAAEKAIHMLIGGAFHKTVYQYLQKYQHKEKVTELELWPSSEKEPQPEPDKEPEPTKKRTKKRTKTKKS